MGRIPAGDNFGRNEALFEEISKPQEVTPNFKEDKKSKKSKKKSGKKKSKK